MLIVRKIKEVNLHFGHDEVYNFPDYEIDNTLIVGSKHLTKLLVTNMLSELIVDYSDKDLIISMFDGDNSLFERKDNKDYLSIDSVKCMGGFNEEALYTFLNYVDSCLCDREDMYLDEQCTDIYVYERKCRISLPYHIVFLNNWDNCFKFGETNENDIYTKLISILDRSYSNKTFIIMSSFGDRTLPFYLQSRFQNILYSKGCENKLVNIDASINSEQVYDNTIVVKSADGKRVLSAINLQKNIKGILKGDKYPFGVTFDQKRLNELSKLYNMEEVPND